MCVENEKLHKNNHSKYISFQVMYKISQSEMLIKFFPIEYFQSWKFWATLI